MTIPVDFLFGSPKTIHELSPSTHRPRYHSPKIDTIVGCTRTTPTPRGRVMNSPTVNPLAARRVLTPVMSEGTLEYPPLNWPETSTLLKVEVTFHLDIVRFLLRVVFVTHQPPTSPLPNLHCVLSPLRPSRTSSIRNSQSSPRT